MISSRAKRPEGIWLMGEWDPHRGANEQSALLKYRREDQWGPEPPKPKMGDAFVIAGAVAGMVVGGVLLGVLLNFVMALVGVVLGGVVGALVGSLVKSFVRNRRKVRAKDSGSH